jgi:hypothetical protein
MTTIPLSGQYGVIKDTLAQELPVNAWSSAQNMVFRDGCAERVRGQIAALNVPTVTPYFLQAFQTSTAKFFVYCGLAKTFADDGTTKTDITYSVPPTGAIDDRWSGGALNGLLLLNNGVDQPVYWAGVPATPCALLTGWTSTWRCASMRSLRNYAVAMDITKGASRYRNMVKWSHAADPGALPSSWDETDATKDAGEQDLSGSDPLVDMLPLGDVGILYKERSMWSMRFIGQPFIWQFLRLPGDVGMLTRGCVVSTPQGHVVLTQGDVVIHSGQGTQSIINAKLRRWIFNNIDSTNYKRAFVTSNPSKNEVWVCFPQSGYAACTLALVWNWTDGTWGMRQLNNATYGATGAATYLSSDIWATDTNPWSSDTTSWDSANLSQAETRLLLSESTPNISIVDTATSNNTAAITAVLERTGIAFDDPGMVKVMTRIRPRFDGPAGQVINIEFGGQMDIEKSIVWSTPIPYTIGSSFEANGFATGRFLGVRFTSIGGQPWRIRSYDVDYENQGMY